MLGLTFLSQAIRSRRDRDMSEDRARQRHADMMKSLSAKHDPQMRLSEDQRAMLASLEKQVQAKPPRWSDKRCPQCARTCVLVDLHDAEIDYCTQCRGCWFDPGELSLTTGNAMDIPGERLAHRASKYTCAVCHTPMTEHVYLDPYNLLVDRCPKGHGVWLEEGELERALRLS